MEQKKNNRNYFANTKTIIIIILVAFVLLVIGLVLYFWLDKKYPTNRDGIVTIYAAIAGGLCTLFGVLFTIMSNEATRREDIKESNKPEFCMPNIYDIAKANRFLIQFEAEPRIPNHFLYFKNTDKTEFSLIELKTNNRVATCNNHFVEKNSLFCVSFYFSETIETIILKIQALDGSIYNYSIDEKNKTLIIQ